HGQLGASGHLRLESAQPARLARGRRGAGAARDVPLSERPVRRIAKAVNAPLGFAGLGLCLNLSRRRLTDALALYDPDAALARPDLAELGLEGLVRAAAYRATEAM